MGNCREPTVGTPGDRLSVVLLLRPGAQQLTIGGHMLEEGAPPFIVLDRGGRGLQPLVPPTQDAFSAWVPGGLQQPVAGQVDTIWLPAVGAG